MFSEVSYKALSNLVLKNLIAEIKRILVMQGRTEPNCLHQLFAIKQSGTDLEKLNTFIQEKR